MSLARWSNAYCQSQSTTLTTLWSLASSCLLLLPSSTTCPGLLRRPHRFGQGKEFGREAVDILWVGHHTPPRAPRLALHLGHPVVDERLGRGHHHFLRRDLHRQHLVALG